MFSLPLNIFQYLYIILLCVLVFYVCNSSFKARGVKFDDFCKGIKLKETKLPGCFFTIALRVVVGHEFNQYASIQQFDV